MSRPRCPRWPDDGPLARPASTTIGTPRRGRPQAGPHFVERRDTRTPAPPLRPAHGSIPRRVRLRDAPGRSTRTNPRIAPMRLTRLREKPLVDYCEKQHLRAGRGMFPEPFPEYEEVLLDRCWKMFSAVSRWAMEAFSRDILLFGTVQALRPALGTGPESVRLSEDRPLRFRRRRKRGLQAEIGLW